MAIAILRRQPWYAPPRLLRTVTGVRRYPVIPLAVLLIVMVIPAIFAPFVAPHDPLDGSLSLRLLPPAWVGEETEVKTAVERIDPSNRNQQILLRDAQRQVERGKARILPAVSGADGGEVTSGSQVEVITKPGGSTKYLLGTDKLGRDILSRIIHGSRISIIVAGIAIFIAGSIGTILGITAGYLSHWVDAILMRLVDISLSIPIVLLALVLVVVVGPGFKTVITVLVILLWAHYARMARGETLTVREQDYIARARVAGASNIRIMLHHIFPNVFNSLVVLATLQVGFVIIVEATLSFLGAGIPRPTPAWGVMIADGRELIVSHWWVAFFPGLAIMLVVLSMNLLGDWLRDKLDPKQRQV